MNMVCVIYYFIEMIKTKQHFFDKLNLSTFDIDIRN